ncbi:MAG: hypothetical protein KHZ04_10875, partial [Dorea sp.]|uniref:hypothetical protein n=1 Tax=Dorea sp. TaxID=2040332 RepID=UPI00257B6F53
RSVACHRIEILSVDLFPSGINIKNLRTSRIQVEMIRIQTNQTPLLIPDRKNNRQTEKNCRSVMCMYAVR